MRTQILNWSKKCRLLRSGFCGETRCNGPVPNHEFGPVAITTYLAIRLVESTEARICRHHCPELVEFVNPRMLFNEEPYPVHHMHEHTEMDGLRTIRYKTSHQGDAFHISEDAF